MKVFQQVMLDGRKRVEEERLRRITGAAPSVDGEPSPDAAAPWASSSSTPVQTGGAITKDIKDATGSSWDHLRAQSFPAKGSAGAAPAAAGQPVESEREKERREFEALLEKERRGEDDDKWK